MAANWKTGGGIASLGKRVLSHASTRDQTRLASLPASALAIRRGAHASVYDKNLDDQVRPSVVPDEVIPQSDEYWAPHPQTGVFGPAAVHNASGAERGLHSSPAEGGADSVLEEKAWFRPTSLEDLEKPHQT